MNFYQRIIMLLRQLRLATALMSSDPFFCRTEDGTVWDKTTYLGLDLYTTSVELIIPLTQILESVCIIQLGLREEFRDIVQNKMITWHRF